MRVSTTMLFTYYANKFWMLESFNYMFSICWNGYYHFSFAIGQEGVRVGKVWRNGKQFQMNPLPVDAHVWIPIAGLPIAAAWRTEDLILPTNPWYFYNGPRRITDSTWVCREVVRTTGGRLVLEYLGWHHCIMPKPPSVTTFLVE